MPPKAGSPNLPNPGNPPKYRFRKAIVYLLWVAVLTVAFWQHQNIQDWWKLRDYQPSVTVAQLATSTGMTDYGRKVFYLQDPHVQAKEKFYVSCAEDENTVVLGCYKPGTGIYILKVDDKRLNGVEQVTSAHEMLHAAYDRLSHSQKKNIDAQLQSAYDGLGSSEIKAKIDLYKQANADILNELHSILATEVEQLPAGLEEYYQQYFKDRQKIVNYANSYKNEFNSRKAKVDVLDKSLEKLVKQIEANNKVLETKQAKLKTESNKLRALLNANDIDAYNTGVRAYNAKLIPFRALISETNQLVSSYRAILAERNKLAAEAQELNRALDSHQIKTVQDI